MRETAPPPVLVEVPAELAIDTGVAERIIVDFIRAQLHEAGFERVVLALSGGIDSALVAYLVSAAIGPSRLLCLLMPYRTSSPASREDAEEVVRGLGCAAEVVDLTAIVDAYFAGSEPASRVRLGNFTARARMAVLYDHSVTWGGLVAGTGNKTELMLGYTTIHGDSASAFNPVGDLYKSQLRQLAADLAVPDSILRKPPSADLWPGQTDEEELGLRYAEVDRLLYWLVDRREEPARLVERGFSPVVIARVERLVATAEFKRQVPPIAKLGRRTAGIDYLYPRRRPGSARTTG